LKIEHLLSETEIVNLVSCKVSFYSWPEDRWLCLWLWPKAFIERDVDFFCYWWCQL